MCIYIYVWDCNVCIEAPTVYGMSLRLRLYFLAVSQGSDVTVHSTHMSPEGTSCATHWKPWSRLPKSRYPTRRVSILKHYCTATPCTEKIPQATSEIVLGCSLGLVLCTGSETTQCPFCGFFGGRGSLLQGGRRGSKHQYSRGYWFRLLGWGPSGCVAFNS